MQADEKSIVTQGSEGFGIGSGHQNRGPEIEQRVHERGTAYDVQVDERFIEKQHGRCGSERAHQAGVGQNDTYEQSFLLSGAGFRGKPAGLQVPEGKIGAVGTESRVATQAVFVPCRAEPGTEPVFDGKRGFGFETFGHGTDQRKLCGRKSTRGVRSGGIQTRDEILAGGDSRDTMTGHGVFDTGEPGRICGLRCKDPVTLGGGAFAGGEFAGMVRSHGDDEAIEKTPSSACTFPEQTVHLRGNPDSGEVIGYRSAGAESGAIQEKFTGAFLLGFHAGGDIECAPVIGEAGCDAPSAVGPVCFGRVPAKIGVTRTAQTTSWSKERKGFEKIGFSAAIIAGNNDGGSCRLPGQPLIITEIRQNEAEKARHRFRPDRSGHVFTGMINICGRDGSQTRIGMST